MARGRGNIVEEPGARLGAMMAAAMRQRQRNDTTSDQRSAMLQNLVDKGWLSRGRGNMVESSGARRAAGEAAIAENEAASDWWSNMRSMERMADRDAAILAAQQSMANAPGRGLQGGQDQITADMMDLDPILDIRYQGGGTADAPMVPDNLVSGVSPQASEVSQQQGVTPSVSQVDTAGTPGGFTVTGDNPYVQNLPEQEQFPKAFAGQGSSQFGGTELGMVPEGRRTEQGFSATDYTTGGPSALGQNLGEAEAVDTVARNALKWVNDLFRKDIDEQQQGEEQQQSGVTATGLGATEQTEQGQPIGGGMNPQEQQELQRIQQNLESTRPAPNADSTVSQPTTGDDRTRQLNLAAPNAQDQSVIERSQGINTSGNADEIIGSLLEKYGSQLQMAGYGEQVKKFASGNYTKADIDGLIGQFGSYLPKDIMAQLKQVSESMVEGANVVAEEVSGLDPNYSKFQGTTSSGSSQWTTQHGAEGRPGFGAKDYNPEVGRTQADKYGRLQEEDFMDYTKRMHERMYPSG